MTKYERNRAEKAIRVLVRHGYKRQAELLRQMIQQLIVRGTDEIKRGSMKGTPLWDADLSCTHKITDGDNFSGIKCSKCNGWYCL